MSFRLNYFPYVDREWFWWLFSITSHMTTFCVFVIWIVHSINLFLDYFTQNRKSVKWRKSIPKIDRLYISISITSYLTITFFLLCGMALCIMQWNIFTLICHEIVLILTSCWIIAKVFMYLTFFLRLHMVYNESKYQYNPKYLKIISAITIIENVINFISTMRYNEIDLILYDQISFAMHCNAYYPLFQYFIAGLSDIIISIGFLIAFIRPIHLILSSTVRTKDKVNNLLNLGMKSLILTANAVFSTLTMLVGVLVLNSLIITPIDCFINCLCVVLMSPYYDDRIFYRPLCCIFVHIGDKYINRNMVGSDSDDVKRKHVVVQSDEINGEETTI